MAEDNKNSFRDMILIIFVVLICFGITIYGIAYLTGKVFSSSPEPEISENERPKEVTTNPQDGDTLTFTSINDAADEVQPDEKNIRTTVTPPKQDNIEVADVQEENTVQTPAPAPVPAPVLQEEKQQAEPSKEIKEPVKQVEKAPAKEPVKAPAKEPVKQAAPKQEVKKETAAQNKKAADKPVPPANKGAYVVQISALQSRDAAEKEAAKYRAKFPDVFIKQVEINGKTWYRVRLGVSQTREQAQQKADKVSSEFKIKPLVTKNN